MKYFTLLVFLIGGNFHLSAQTGTVSGRVMDAKTREPLPFTNVYVNNTTLGVTTNNQGEFTLLKLPIGVTELVFSFLGYTTQQVRVIISQTTNLSLTISLSPDAQPVSEVTIKANRDKTWEKQERRFEKVFFGTAADCNIRNPWVLDFTQENGKTTAKSLLPLEIDNQTLGYKLFFQLKNCSYSDTEFAIVGSVRFTEMETANARVAHTWMTNRERAYRGSAKQLMKAMLDRRINQEGFLLFQEKDKGKPRGKNFTQERQTNLLPVDTTSLVMPASSSHTYQLAIKQRIEVHYTPEFSATPFYSDVPYPVSWLEVRGGYVLINQDGTLLNPTQVAISGSMAEGRVSAMLPLDYKPGSLVVPLSPTRLLAKKLQENVYLHTDRPYYYPGESLWFSAYMKYRVPGMMDSLSKVLYVDLISEDKRIIQTRILPIDSGRAANAMVLPASLKPGQYVLRAYTNWMRNYGAGAYFYKPIHVLSLDKGVGGVSPMPVPDGLLHIQLDKSAYPTRSLVNLSLRLDTTSQSETGSFSITVFDETRSASVVEPTSIKTVDFSEPAQDALATIHYPVERGITLTGNYTDKKGRPKRTNLTFVPENMGNLYPVTTGTHGEFTLSTLAFYDSVRFIIQPAEGKVVLLTKDQPNLPERLPNFDLPLVSLRTPHRVYSADTLQARLLTEVNVAAKKSIRSESSYGQPDVLLSGESLTDFATVADARAAKLPSFKLVQDQQNWYLIWARASLPNSKDLSGSDLSAHEPNLYINNVLVVGETAGNRLMQLSPTLIDHIEVNGMITANQGANGSTGLVNVYIKRTTNTASKPLSWIKIRGFDPNVPFSSPNYAHSTPSAPSTDDRTTLHWNPSIKLNAHDAPRTLCFYTANQAGTYRIVIEGVTNRGHPIHAEAVLTVKE